MSSSKPKQRRRKRGRRERKSVFLKLLEDNFCCIFLTSSGKKNIYQVRCKRHCLKQGNIVLFNYIKIRTFIYWKTLLWKWYDNYKSTEDTHDLENQQKIHIEDM